MVFALLAAAIIWNLGTWYFGLPSSSSHTMVGSIIGVGIANQLMSARNGTSGVDWGQAANVGKTLLISPIVGFVCAALLLLLSKAIFKNKKLYEAPEGTEPPPWWIRGLLVLTCTGVSFAHGSNNGQKGMGLIMLILIGTVPMAYALNHAVTPAQTMDFVAVSQQAADTVHAYVSPNAVIGDPRATVTDFIRTREFTPALVKCRRFAFKITSHGAMVSPAAFLGRREVLVSSPSDGAAVITARTGVHRRHQHEILREL
jgi:inorganic phosphate transporter, PiT family